MFSTFLDTAIVRWVLLLYFKLTTANIEKFCRHKSLLVLHARSNNSGATDVKKMRLFLKQNYLLRCWRFLSLWNWIGALTLSLSLKLPPRRLKPYSFHEVSFFRSTKFICISIYLLYGFEWDTVVIHVWASAPGHYLDLLDKLQKPVRRTLDPSLAAFLELLPMSFL